MRFWVHVSGCVFLTPLLFFCIACEGSGCGKNGVLENPKQNAVAETLNKFNEMNAQTPQRAHRNAEAVLPFLGLTGGEQTDRRYYKSSLTTKKKTWFYYSRSVVTLFSKQIVYYEGN